MSEVENLIYQFEGQQQEMMLYFHSLLTIEFGLTSKVSFNNPCYYGRSWICYLKPVKGERIEFAFLRGNELSNDQKILESKGRKQLRSLEFEKIKDIPVEFLNDIIQEAILLDETTPYESKRKSKK